MIGALWRYLRARRRLHRHQAQDRAIQRAQLAAGTACGARTDTLGVGCTEPVGHTGGHRTSLGTADLHLGRTEWLWDEELGWQAVVVERQQLRWAGRG